MDKNAIINATIINLAGIISGVGEDHITATGNDVTQNDPNNVQNTYRKYTFINPKNANF